MVNRGDGVELPLEVTMENGVARKRAADVMPFRPQSFHDGLDEATGSGYSAITPIDGLATADALPVIATRAATPPAAYNRAR